MKKLAHVLVAAFVLSGTALVIGCGGGNGTPGDGGTDSPTTKDTGTPDSGPPKDSGGGKDSGHPMKDGGGKDTGTTCPTFPAFVIDMVMKDTNNTSDPTPIPSCWGTPAKPVDPQTDTEFKSIVP